MKLYTPEEIILKGDGKEKPLNYDLLYESTRKIIDEYDGDCTILRNVKRMVQQGDSIISPYMMDLFICNHDFPIITSGFDRPNGVYYISPEFTEYIDTTYNSILRGGTVEPIGFGKVKLIQILRMDLFYNNQYHITFKFRKDMTPVNAFINRDWIWLDPQGEFKGLFYPDSENAKIISENKFKIYDILTKGQGRKLKPHQRTGVQFFLEKKKAMNADIMGMGKSQDVNTIIPMADGTFKKLKDIVVGDRVLSSLNQPTTVTNVYDCGKKWIYYLGLSNGIRVNSSIDHRWYYRYDGEDTFRLNSLEDILGVKEEDMVDDDTELGGQEFILPKPIIFPQVASITNFRSENAKPMHESDIDEHLNLVGGKYPDFLRYEMEKQYALWLAEVLHTQNLEICGYTPFDKMYVQYREDFINLHYGGKPIKNMRDIRVHDIVYRLSLHKRRIIVCLLFNNAPYLDFKDMDMLRRDIVRLIMSCGFLATVRGTMVYFGNSKKYDRFLNRDDSTSLTYAEDDDVTINGEDFLYCRQIYRSHIADCRCIEVDSPDHTYLTEGYTVTHNTTTAVVSAIETNSDKTLIITTATLKTNWKRELMNYVKEEDISIVTPKNLDLSKRFVICNYDILKKYITIPEEPVFKTLWVIDETTGKRKKVTEPVMVKNSKGELVQKMRKSKNKELIEEAFKNSPLYKERFGTVIIDEAHKLSNNKSKMYSCVYDFLQKEGNGDNVFLLTGTPITNKPINLFHVLKLIDADITRNYQAYVHRYCGARRMNLKDGRQVLLTNGVSNLSELAERIKDVYIRREYSDVEGFVDKNVETLYYDLSEEQEEKLGVIWEEYVNEKFMTSPDEIDINILDHRAFLEMGIVRKYLSMQMIPNTVEKIDEVLEMGSNEKVVVACNYTEELEKFKEIYGDKCVLVYGDVKDEDRDKAIDEFLNNPKVRVFVGNIKASSVGLSLTSSRWLFFNSVSLLGIDNEQMEARIQRLTSTQTANVFYQYFTDKFSTRVKEILDEKKETHNSLIFKEEDKYNKTNKLKDNEYLITYCSEPKEGDDGKWYVYYNYQGHGKFGDVERSYDTLEEAQKLELCDKIFVNK